MAKWNSGPGTLFFIHRGPLQPYVRASILQARSVNPKSQIVLLGDQPRLRVSREILAEVTYAELKDYSESATKFGKLFRFDGKNPIAYTRGNFQRWFQVHSFCEKQSVVGPLLVLDSDAFLYLAVSDIAPQISTSMTVVDKVGPQFTFFRDLTTLAEFTAFLNESFSTDEGFQQLAQFVHESGDAGLPHVSDMAAFGVYARINSLEDLGAPDRGTFIFCENIGSSQGLEMGLIGKRLTLEKGRRFFSSVGGKKVLAGGVHLQGGNKDLWPYFVDSGVRSSLRQSSPREYSSALRAARKKAFRIAVLKTSAYSRNFIIRRLNLKR
jgi:hypothetical protein